ncbi:MAG: glycosyltransferase [Erysipelotrichaceae bacterium]
MKKALMYASVASMIQQFNMDNIKLLKELGYEVDVACNFEFGSTISLEKISQLKLLLKSIGVGYYHIPIPRKIGDLKNLRISYRRTKKLMDEKRYNLIHCHSPIGGVICRMANKNSKGYNQTKMIYTAHGFHFFNGSSIGSWLLFYPIEKHFSRYTDILITINEADYKLAKNKLKAKKVVKIDGVGIQYDKIISADHNNSILEEYRFNDDDFFVFSVGELNDNKNHATIIEAIHILNNPKIKYFIAGKGPGLEVLNEIIHKYRLENQVHFLGYRSDVFSLYKVMNVFAFPSKREGLGLAAIEAMAAGLPILTSNINGINDYSKQGITGFLYNPTDAEGFAQGINYLFTNPSKSKIIGEGNILRAKKYDVKFINKKMNFFYNN